MHVVHTLKPIYDKNSKILILGSMPSTKSRINNFYYSNKTNRFWKIIESLFNIKFENYQDMKNFLLNHNIALWDVIKECDIEGSSDSSIKNVIPNDLSEIINNSNIKYIFTTGKTAYKYYNKYLKNIIKKDAICLPSPSAANASYSLKDLIISYQIIIKYL